MGDFGDASGADRSSRLCQCTMRRRYLADDEVELVVDEHLELLAELLLHGRLAFAAQVRRRLTEAARHQRVALASHFPRYAARRRVYRFTLYMYIAIRGSREVFCCSSEIPKSSSLKFSAYFM